MTHTFTYPSGIPDRFTCRSKSQRQAVLIERNFHQNVSCRPNDGTKAEERGAAIKGSACARTVGDSEPPAIAAAERKLGHSFACGAGGGLITQLKGVTGR